MTKSNKPVEPTGCKQGLHTVQIGNRICFECGIDVAPLQVDTELQQSIKDQTEKDLEINRHLTAMVTAADVVNGTPEAKALVERAAIAAFKDQDKMIAASQSSPGKSVIDILSSLVGGNKITKKATIERLAPAIEHLITLRVAEGRIDEIEKMRQQSAWYDADPHYTKYPFHVIEQHTFKDRLKELKENLK